MVENEEFIEYLDELFPEAKCELNYSNNFELLVAVILSAQCTDKRVNLVTSKLFKRFKTIKSFANAPVEEIEKRIYSCGFYKIKASNIKSCAIDILNKFNGEVPEDYLDLMSLAGVGRKTANVVSSVAFNKNYIAVDTHVLRVSRRLGFTESLKPNVCEKDLEERFKNQLGLLHQKMVLFGRYHCKALKPNCYFCKLRKKCSYFKIIRRGKRFLKFKTIRLKRHSKKRNRRNICF